MLNTMITILCQKTMLQGAKNLATQKLNRDSHCYWCATVKYAMNDLLRITEESHQWHY